MSHSLLTGELTHPGFPVKCARQFEESRQPLTWVKFQTDECSVLEGKTIFIINACLKVRLEDAVMETETMQD